MTPGEFSVPKIQVSGDFKLGDVSGQAAIGENITQTVYKDCTFILPDGSNVHGKSWLYTQGIRPTTDPTNIFGRERELDKIDEFFKDIPALVITGYRGTGKSTLASMYLDRLGKRGTFVGMYWRKVDETIDISDVVGGFLTVVGKPIKDLGQYKIGDQLNLLFRELNAAPYFLVLDNFEIVLDSQTNVSQKPGFSELIEKANESAGRSRVLFTSWEYPASERGIRPKCYPIGGIDEAAAIQLLRKSGLTEHDNELKKVIELSGGHPLALILLVQIVKEGAETLSSILDDNTLWLGEKGEVAERILDKVYTERLNTEECRLLQYLSLLREPLPTRAIATIANDPGWTDIFIKKIASNLIRKSLLQKTGENYWEESLIQNYMYIKMFDKAKRHGFAYQYYLSLPMPKKRTNKEDLRFLIEAYYHACMAKEYDKAASIILDYNLHENLERFGEYRTLVEIYHKILPKDPLRETPLISNIQTHCSILGNLGVAYSTLSQERIAIEYYEKALEISQKVGDKHNESASFGNLGRAHILLGRPKDGIIYYEKALEIARQIGDRKAEGIRIGNIGNAYSDLGEKRTAIEYYEKAMKIAQEIGEIRNQGVWLGNIGNAYSILGEQRKAIECYGKAKEIALQIGDKQSECAWLGGLGNAYNNLGETEAAIEYFKKALEIAQKIGDKRNEGGLSGNIGCACYALRDIKNAITYFENALNIAQEIVDKLGELTWLGNIGNVYRTMGKRLEAVKYYERAVKIAKEIGDRRGEGTWLGGLGNAYRDLGEMGKTFEYYAKALKIAHEIGDRGNEGVWFNNLGNIFRDKKKYKEALSFYLLAKDIFTQIEDPDIETTESSLKNLKEELGEKEFEQLEAEVGPKKEEIIKKMLKEIDE
ncbi:MAG: hypothetical protein A3G93_03080 [Nitrospinae bacterium RIFCSPLOWO2_12_FULL_45_22]|nr:MAG: hypothetical protein A3G93_03080 [Nitrospinae bacterium RIFCSPLOWO2_12_FULL_45_22]